MSGHLFREGRQRKAIPLDAPPRRNRRARPIVGTENASFPFWSPDSRFIAFFADGKLKKVDLTGAPALTICEVNANPRSGSWNRDGIILFSPGSLAAIHKVSAAGGVAVPVTTIDGKAGETTHRWASFLPDGRHFVYMVGTHSAGTRSEANAIYVASIDSHEKTLLLRARSNAVYASGHLLYVRDRIEAKGSAVSIGAPVPLFPLFDVSLALAGDISADHNRFLLAVSPNARQNEPITLVTNWPATLHK